MNNYTITVSETLPFTTTLPLFDSNATTNISSSEHSSNSTSHLFSNEIEIEEGSGLEIIPTTESTSSDPILNYIHHEPSVYQDLHVYSSLLEAPIIPLSLEPMFYIEPSNSLHGIAKAKNSNNNNLPADKSLLEALSEEPELIFVGIQNAKDKLKEKVTMVNKNNSSNETTHKEKKVSTSTTLSLINEISSTTTEGNSTTLLPELEGLLTGLSNETDSTGTNDLTATSTILTMTNQTNTSLEATVSSANSTNSNSTKLSVPLVPLQTLNCSAVNLQKSNDETPIKTSASKTTTAIPTTVVNSSSTTSKPPESTLPSLEISTATSTTVTLPSSSAVETDLNNDQEESESYEKSESLEDFDNYHLSDSINNSNNDNSKDNDNNNNFEGSGE